VLLEGQAVYHNKVWAMAVEALVVSQNDSVWVVGDVLGDLCVLRGFEWGHLCPWAPPEAQSQQCSYEASLIHVLEKNE
jgi:hypothetical protein